MIVGTQSPIDRGGILLTDRRYKNFEVYMEVKPDWGCDSGLFLRSSEAGEAYQVTLDYLPGGGMLAALLDWPYASVVNKIEVKDGQPLRI